MAKQAINWTALPNGYSDDGKSLRISLLVSPRLEPDSDESLKAFPDFVDWPATLAQSHFVLNYGAGPPVKIAGNANKGRTRVDNRIGTADSKVWRALFPPQTFVQGFEWRDLTHHTVLSYAAAEMDNLVRDLYSRLAASAVDQLPTASTFLGDQKFPGDQKWRELLQVLTENDRAFTDPRSGIRRTDVQFKLLRAGAFKNNNLARFELFHTPPSTPRVKKDKVQPGDTKRPAEWLGYDQVPLPKPDDIQKEFHFHKIVAAMNQYPTLLRKLGLVVDLLVPRDAFTPAADALLSVEVELPPGSPGVERVPDASPRTHALLDARRFQAVPMVMPAGQGGFRVGDGLLDLDPQTFAVLQADVDGSALKMMNFARSLMMLDGALSDHQIDPVTKKERELGAPSLRNAGLMLVHTKRGDLLEATISRQSKFNETASKRVEAIKKVPAVPIPDPPEMFGQDLIRGYRIDIWDDVTRSWHSLCQRQAIYDIASGTVVIDVPAEEGTVRLAATTSRDKTSNPDIIWLHETLVSWAGWSLCAPPPGKTIHHQTTITDPNDPSRQIIVHKDPVGEPEAVVPAGLRLRSVFKALPGTLPRLRYGRSYWLRARAVDLAGNSLEPQPKDFGPEKPKGNARRYFRFDPISAPAIALVKPTPATLDKPAEGESMERMAVRTFNDTPDLNTVATTQRTRRFAVPSRTTQREAEQHGMLDRGGVVDATFFSMLAAQDNSLDQELVSTAGPLTGVSTVETQYAVMLDGDPLPYLPDPLAVEIGARIFDHPDFPAEKIIQIPFYDGTEWPEALPFKIEIYENPADGPHYDAALKTLFIPLPKATRATLRLSVLPSVAAMRILGIWNWLTPAQQTTPFVINGQSTTLEKVARKGQHWMLTPWRNLELVHAVQRPLITPELLKLRIGRGANETFAQPIFTAPCSIASTDRVDLRANWNEPFDDGGSQDPGNHPRIDHAFSIKITDKKTYNDVPEYSPAGTDLIAINQGSPFNFPSGVKFHEFHDTRYRRIEYWPEATTKFREFMPAGLLMDAKQEPTEENIRVVGSKVRTWIPSSAPPPAPEVLYVVPTFGWVRSGDEAGKQSWRRGGGLRVYLNRPWNVTGYGEMLAVVLPGANFTGDPNDVPRERPLKNFVTQWGNDPIWLSPFVPGISPKLINFPLARTKPDPDGKWLPKFAPPEEADQRPVNFATTGLQLPDFPNPPTEGRVDIAPHDVFYDEQRQLWYCDIEVTWGTAYFPFIRLALARYQPEALDSALLSHVVLADFMPLVPDRWLNVMHTNDLRTRQVRVFGYTYSDSSSHEEVLHSPGPVPVSEQPPKVAASSVVEVWVERFEPTLGEDFGWLRETQAIVQSDAQARTQGTTNVLVNERLTSRDRARAKELLKAREFEALIDEGLISQIFVSPTLWEGSVTLPAPTAAATRYRLAIAEYEEYLVDPPGNPEYAYDLYRKAKDRRMVFIEYVEM
jgi:hypothetical protein